MPVPTAVPPRGSSRHPGEHGVEPLGGVPASRRSHRTPGPASPASRPSGACGRTSPGRRTPSPCASSGGAARRAPGSRSSVTASAAATWIAVGKVSLLDWLALTWSLGWTSTPAAGGERRDHLVGVHVGAGARAGLEDVDRELVVVLGRRRPRGGGRDRVGASSASTPSRPFAAAAAALTWPSAWISARLEGVPLIGKFSTARWVWALHSASAGTRTSPMESCSMRKSSALTLDGTLDYW